MTTTTTSPMSTEGAPEPAAAAATDEQSLRKLAIRGSMWAVGGYGASMVLRLGSNVVLWHLLLPEDFGLMLLVNVFLQGLEMFSDLGVRVSIVQHARGADPDFLNTAWTVQVLRGITLFLISCLIGWPAAAAYGDPRLRLMIPVAALACVINGFQSTSLSMLNRKMQVGLLIRIGLIAQVVAVGVMIAWAWVSRSVWALLASGLVNAVMHVILSFTMVPGSRNRFHWDPEAKKALLGFGRWVFLSTAFTFLAGQSDKLLLGRFLDKAMLGIYGVAVTLSGAVQQVVWEMCQWVLMPAFSQVHREDGTRLGGVFDKVRSRLDLFALPCLGVLIAAGDVVVHVIWPAQARDAGWMLQILSVGVALFYVLPFAWSLQAAWGDLRYWLWGNVGRTAWLWLGVPIVWAAAGEHAQAATIWWVALSQLPPLLCAWLRLRRDGILSLRRELLAAAYLGGGLVLGWAAKLGLASVGIT